VGLDGHIIAPGDESNEYRPERRWVNVIGAIPGDIRNGLIYIEFPSANSPGRGESKEAGNNRLGCEAPDSMESARFIIETGVVRYQSMECEPAVLYLESEAES
jgi:hypothetical protein